MTDDAWEAYKRDTKPLKRTHTFHEANEKNEERVTLPHKPIKAERPIVEILLTGTQGKPLQLMDLSPKQRRKLQPEASLDLHGMTKAQAYENLIRFVGSCVQSRRKIILVITGKGRLTPSSSYTTLRDSLPLWVSESPLNQWVISLTQARPEHGGGGSFYLQLRTVR